MDAKLEPVGAYAYTMAGPRQTQVRACLEGILQLARRSSGDIVIKPVCNAGVDGLRKVLRGQFSRFGPHADVWDAIRQAASKREGKLEIERVDAHADPLSYVENGLVLTDWIGNEVSDHLAGKAAEANAVSEEQHVNWMVMQSRANKILLGAVEVHRMFLGEAGANVVRGEWVRGPHPVHAAITASGHKFVKDDRGAYQCTRCGQRVGSRNLKQWLLGPKCAAFRPQGEDWAAIGGQARGARVVQIGNIVTDPSHTLAWKRGVWYGSAWVVAPTPRQLSTTSRPATSSARCAKSLRSTGSKS